MKVNWRERRNKVMIASLSALLLAGHMPFNVAAQESDDAALDISLETATKETETRPDSVEEVTSEPRRFKEISEFIHNFNDLTIEEINLHIETFKLFTDDSSVVHSVHEEINEEINQLKQESLSGVIEHLKDIRNENISDLEENPNLINKDLIEENVDTSLVDSQLLNDRYSMMTTSSTQTITRLQGLNRYETAISISQSGWKQADTVVIVNANGFADALAGAPLAKALNAPVLLAGSRSAETLKEIERLGTKKAIILGGQAAVSNTFEKELSNKNIAVERIAGDTRYETANLIANKTVALTKATKAILVSGEDFADAMSIAPFAASQGMPIYLTRKASLGNEVKKASEKISDWTIIGGSSAISGTVETELQSRVNAVKRIEGIDRYETNRQVITHFKPSTEKIYVATGLDFMDALTGSVLAAKNNTGVLLVRNSEAVLDDTVKFSVANNLLQLTIFGGVAAINERVESTLQEMKLPSPKPLIFIDIGHGGSDPGAQYGGIKEKDIVLPTSLMLKDLLVNSGDYDIILSRENDKYLTLAQRSSHANRVKADISISIHVNAMGGKWAGLARGIETFIYHPSYTTTRLAFDMNNYRIKESLRLADAVHNSLITNTGLRSRGVRGANLHMVREPDMPAILPELGFLDNAGDRSIVTTYKFQKTAAESIKQGIDIYFGN